MGVVGRLDQYASMLAGEFDDYSMSENLIKNSENLTIAGGFWSEVGDGVTVTTNQVTAPDGTQTADKVAIKNTNSGSKGIQSSVTPSVIGQSYTASIFCKAAEHNYVRVDMEGGGNSGGIVVNLLNGSLILQVSAPDTYSIQAYPNGWYRISATSTASTTAGSALRVYLTDVSGSTLFVGTTGNGVYMWGGQYESSSSVTDYTPTTTTAISRVLPATTNTNITGLGTYYSSGFDENVGFTTFLSANIFAPYDLVYDEFSGTSFGAGQGRYMRQNTDKSVIVYNEIDEISDFRDIVRSGLVLDLDAGMNASFNNTGTTWNDLSGNGNNGTLVLGPTYSSANGGSIVFDGTNDYSTSTSVTNSLTTLQKEGSLTYEYWIKPTASIKLGYTESNSGSSFYSPGNATPQGLSGDLAYNYGDGGSIYVGFGFAFGTNGFVAGVHKNGYAPTILVDYQTYNGISHLVVIKNATNCSYYVNGVLKKASLTIAGGATIIGDTMSFVANSAGAFMNVFKGDIYSVKFYNRALTAAEILQNYNALKHRFGL